MIAARDAAATVQNVSNEEIDPKWIEEEAERIYRPLLNYKNRPSQGVLPYDMEVRLQKIMDEYAGGVSTYYEMNEERLMIARKQLAKIPAQFEYLVANDLHQLMKAHEIIDRVDVARVLVEHLLYRKETRWPSYQTRMDYPKLDDENWLKFVNSRVDRKTGEIEMLTRPYEQLIPGDRYKPR